MSSNLESEDLVGVQLVRMEDVQPARDRPSNSSEGSDQTTDDVKTFTVDGIDYENECAADDDDSNIGSMVSIQSEEMSGPSEEVSMESQPDENAAQMLDSDDDSSSEMIVPEVVKPRKLVVNVPQTPKKETKSVPDSWPTLEILPGGVIRRSEYTEKNIQPTPTFPKEEGNTSDVETGEKMYACAKCSKSFKYLYCLVKHVRWHENQKKKQQQDLSKLLPIEKEMIYIKKQRFELEKSYKKEKVDVLARIAGALSKIENIQDILK